MRHKIGAQRDKVTLSQTHIEQLLYKKQSVSEVQSIIEYYNASNEIYMYVSIWTNKNSHRNMLHVLQIQLGINH